jgi:hypothetical protein
MEFVDTDRWCERGVGGEIYEIVRDAAQNFPAVGLA